MAPTLNVTVEIINQTGTAMNFRLDGPVDRSFVVPAWGSNTVYLAAGWYGYTVSAVGFEPESGSRYFEPGNWSWTWSEAP
jgi:hypothetical protein